jgi:hypothetical protein
MGVYLIYAAGLIGPFLIIMHREAIGDLMGEPTWSKPIGGIYAVVVYIAIAIFFWTVAEMTHSTDVLFHFLTYFVGGAPKPNDFGV